MNPHDLKGRDLLHLVGVLSMFGVFLGIAYCYDMTGPEIIIAMVAFSAVSLVLSLLGKKKDDGP